MTEDQKRARKEYQRQYQKDRRANDPEYKEKQNAYAREYHKVNKQTRPLLFKEQQAQKKKRSREWQDKNALVIKARLRERYANEPEYRLKIALQKYGLTPDQYRTMIKAQNGVCAICFRACRTYARLSIDHIKGTKTVRGLLCTQCNKGIGALDHDPDLLIRAAQYLIRTTPDLQEEDFYFTTGAPAFHVAQDVQ